VDDDASVANSTCRLIRSLGMRGEAFFSLLRCFLWVVSELVDGWYGQFELTGSVVGGGSEVDEVSESPSHSFC